MFKDEAELNGLRLNANKNYIQSYQERLGVSVTKIVLLVTKIVLLETFHAAFHY